MPKKKSYMNKENILSEGFLQSFIKIILQEIKKLEADLQKSYEKSDELYDDAKKYMKTQGIDLPDMNDKKAKKKFWDMVYKEIG